MKSTTQLLDFSVIRTFRFGIFCAVCCLATYSYSQSPRLQKEIKVITTYDHFDHVENQLIQSSKPRVYRDTITTEYNFDGSQKQDQESPLLHEIIDLDSTNLIFLNDIPKHEMEYFSNGERVDVYSFFYQDSTIEIKLIDHDTIEIGQYYYKRGKLKEHHITRLRENHSPYKEVLIYHSKKHNRKDHDRIVTSRYSTKADTAKYYQKWGKRNIHKEYNFNPIKNEWYLTTKIISTPKKRREWNTLFHEYHKQYFTTQITTYYNEYGLPTLKTVYDKDFKLIENSTSYSYRYYASPGQE